MPSDYRHLSCLVLPKYNVGSQTDPQYFSTVFTPFPADLALTFSVPVYLHLPDDIGCPTPFVLSFFDTATPSAFTLYLAQPSPFCGGGSCYHHHLFFVLTHLFLILCFLHRRGYSPQNFGINACILCAELQLPVVPVLAPVHQVS